MGNPFGSQGNYSVNTFQLNGALTLLVQPCAQVNLCLSEPWKSITLKGLDLD